MEGSSQVSNILGDAPEEQLVTPAIDEVPAVPATETQAAETAKE